jgi:hypothetical protein
LSPPPVYLSVYSAGYGPKILFEEYKAGGQINYGAEEERGVIARLTGGFASRFSRIRTLLKGAAAVFSGQFSVKALRDMLFGSSSPGDGWFDKAQQWVRDNSPLAKQTDRAEDIAGKVYNWIKGNWTADKRLFPDAGPVRERRRTRRYVRCLAAGRHRRRCVKGYARPRRLRALNASAASPLG